MNDHVHPTMLQTLAGVAPVSTPPTYHCATCKDTGNRAGLVFGYMDCTHCGIAEDRVVFDAWLVEQDFRPRVNAETAWLIYRHGQKTQGAA
jgi:hypothetical protein